MLKAVVFGANIPLKLTTTRSGATKCVGYSAQDARPIGCAWSGMKALITPCRFSSKDE